MKYVYGPIPSRRLGQSLGIDPIPLKTCNWNCVYCQLGRSVPLIHERRDYVPPAAVLSEVRAALAAHPPGAIDWVSFVGSGEPTLHASIGQMIREVKAITAIPVAVITNGSLLYRPEVCADLLAADAVLPTLVAGTASLYRAIVRPWPDLTFDRLVEGMIAFRGVYTGKLWVEVMLINGLNDSETALHDLAAVLRRVAPDAIHLTLPDRPPAEPWVAPPDEARVLRAVAVLGKLAQVVHPARGSVDLSGSDDLLDAVVAVITRHPVPETELARALQRWTPGQVARALEDLAASGRAQVVTHAGQRFWSSARAKYASNRPAPSPGVAHG
jgi:wyosine [tRNA(Phe)-imidazoG37] synthetase (radical SAM superfamily)